MGIEIERKFLINFDAINHVEDEICIQQGYILNTPEKVVRVRMTDQKSFITIKGKNVGPSRPEFEYEIPEADAMDMLDNMCDSVIVKTRFIFSIFGDVWEIDIFDGDNEGLIVAEVEIPSEDYDLRLPKWVLKDVTDDPKYYNNNLITNPYKNWTDEEKNEGKL